MKSKQHGQWTAPIIHWAIKNWYRLGWVIFGLGVLYFLHEFLDVYNIMGVREWEFMDYLTKRGTLS